MIVELSQVYHYPLVTMDTAAPDGAPPRWIGDKKIKKISLPIRNLENLCGGGSFL